MYRLVFTVPAERKEDVLDVLLPLLPGGVHEDGDRLVAFSGAPFEPAVLEAAHGVVDEVPADWRLRRMGEGVTIGGRVAIRSPFDPPPGDGVIDVVVERRGSAFGSGSHPTTQMCVALLLDVPVGGGAADLGCGVGTLAIAAAKLGWTPVVAVDRVPVAVEVAVHNAARNGVDVACAVSDLAVGDVPLAPLLLVNAPPPVQQRVAAALTPLVRDVIVSGIVSDEVPDVVERYRAAGYEVVAGLGTEDEWIALRLSC